MLYLFSNKKSYKKAYVYVVPLQNTGTQELKKKICMKEADVEILYEHLNI